MIFSVLVSFRHPSFVYFFLKLVRHLETAAKIVTQRPVSAGERLHPDPAPLRVLHPRQVGLRQRRHRHAQHEHHAQEGGGETVLHLCGEVQRDFTSQQSCVNVERGCES